MVNIMNKEKIINELQQKTNYKYEQCCLICDTIEKSNTLNKQKIIDNLEKKLNISKKESNMVYEEFISIIKKGIKNKLIHPIGNKD